MAPKKTPKKKAAKKSAAKKSAAKKSPAKKAAAKKNKAASKAPKTQEKADETLPIQHKRKSKDTPAVFKVKTKKPQNIVFTPEDALKILKERKVEEIIPPAPKKAAKKRAAKKKAAAPAPIPETQEKRTFQAASMADILGIQAAPKKSAEPKPVSPRKIPAKFKKYYNLLVKMRDELRDGISYHTEETLGRSAREDSGDLSGYGPHQADAGTETFDRDLALSLVSSEQEALNEIEDAIERIFKGTYGICEITGEEISKERLEAVPFTRYSLDGQAQHERTRRHKVDRGNVFTDEDEDAPILASSDDGDE